MFLAGLAISDTFSRNLSEFAAAEPKQKRPKVTRAAKTNEALN